MSHIELISPPENSSFRCDAILAACHRQHVMAGHGEAFAGRPVTALIDTGSDVLKLRTEYQLPVISARRFVLQAIERERLLAVHHPLKTWFLWTPEGANDAVVIGNITPHLQALNLLEKDPPAASGEGYSRSALTQLMTQMLDDYLAVLTRHELSLDLCLSNFGLDADGRLFYLDDDFYPGNSLTILSDALGTWVRALDWMDEALAAELGGRLVRSLRHYYSDAHVITVVAEGLRGVFVPPPREAIRQTLINALYGEQTFSYHAAETPDSTVLALIGDIHGNAPALECALEYLAQRGISRGVMLGDVVGYGPHPQQCVDMIQQLSGWSMVRGNHDHAVAIGELRTGISGLASWSLKWTIDQLSAEQRQWLGELPVYQQGEQWLAVHGSPRDKTFFNAYVYQMTYVENLDELAVREVPLCFHGHTHIQKSWLRQRGEDVANSESRQQLSTVAHALICPGSIGQPRGGEPGVELAIIDLVSRELEYHRLPYDMEQTLSDMSQQQFPLEMAERLRRGQ